MWYCQELIYIISTEIMAGAALCGLLLTSIKYEYKLMWKQKLTMTFINICVIKL